MPKHQRNAPRRNVAAATIEYSFLEYFHRDLRESIGAGAALAVLSLAGCGGEATLSTDDPNATPTDGSGGGGGSGGSAAEATPHTALASLAPYPSDGIGCFGPISDSLLYGPQCCFEARCYAPADGAGCATSFESAELAELRPPGSGSSGCQVEDEGRPSMSGP